MTKSILGLTTAGMAFFLLFVLPISGGCFAPKNEGFAIYLTAEDVAPMDMVNLSHFDLAAKPIISTDDIVSFNAETYEIKLTAGAYGRITDLEVPVRGKTFVVCDDKKPIYWGAFWTPISSMSFGGVTIWQWLGSQEENTITLELGYPSQSFNNGEDPRGNTAIIRSLRQAGKLTGMAAVADQLPHAIKGYELYSWSQDGEWHFTLITGTNRNKTLEEIIAPSNTVTADGWVQIHVTGVDAIETVIGRIPQGEWVSWLGDMREPGITSPVYFAFPDSGTVSEIKDFVLQRGLNFKPI